MDIDNNRYSYAAAWEDFDNDGDQDLYVANDFGRKTTSSVTTSPQVANSSMWPEIAVALDPAQGMSVSWADFNRDGLMDVYVGNMFSSAGNRIVTQTQFKPDVRPANAGHGISIWRAEIPCSRIGVSVLPNRPNRDSAT